MIGLVIFDLLSKADQVTAIVPASRITPVKRLQATDLPAITYQVIDEVPSNTKDNVSKLNTLRISIHAWTKSYAQACDLTKKIKISLDRFRGINNEVNVDKIVYDNKAELYEDDVEVYHHVVDFKVRIKL